VVVVEMLMAMALLSGAAANFEERRSR